MVFTIFDVNSEPEAFQTLGMTSSKHNILFKNRIVGQVATFKALVDLGCEDLGIKPPVDGGLFNQAQLGLSYFWQIVLTIVFTMFLSNVLLNLCGLIHDDSMRVCHAVPPEG